MYYKNKLPTIGDIVFIEYLHESDTGLGVYVELIEYDNREGLILGTDIGPGKRAVRADKIFKHSKSYPCYVMGVDEEKGTIDLSYKKVSKDKIPMYEKNFIYIQKLLKLYDHLEKLKLVDEITLRDFTLHKLINNTTLQQEINVQNIYTKVLENPEMFFDKDMPTTKEILDQYVTYMKKHIVFSPAEIFLNFSMTILENNAIKKINDILDCIQTKGDHSVRICYMAPKYRIYIEGKTTSSCKEYMETIKSDITQQLTKYSHVLSFDEFKTDGVDKNIIKENEVKFS